MESAKKRTLINDSVYFFSIFLLLWSFLAILGLWGAFGALAFSRGPPRAPMSSLTSIATLTPGLVQPPVQLGKFMDFWGLPKQ